MFCKNLGLGLIFKIKPRFLATDVLLCFPGFRSRSWEPEAGRLRNPETPVYILFLGLMKAYIFYHSRNKLLKSLFTNILYFELWEPGAAEPGAVSKSTAPKP